MHAQRHARRLVTLTAVLLFVASTTAAARADGGNRTHHVEFASTVQIVGGDFGCDPTSPARCAGTFRTIRTFTGDLEGTAYVTGSAVLLGDGTYQGQGVAQFTGTVDGCGSGTLVMLETGILDPATGQERGTWSVTAGQGTGDLAQVSGSGSSDAGAEGTTGTIRCR